MHDFVQKSKNSQEFRRCCSCTVLTEVNPLMSYISSNVTLDPEAIEVLGRIKIAAKPEWSSLALVEGRAVSRDRVGSLPQNPLQ
jgi:hypothetical protein